MDQPSPKSVTVSPTKGSGIHDLSTRILLVSLDPFLTKITGNVDSSLASIHQSLQRSFGNQAFAMATPSKNSNPDPSATKPIWEL
jgi:hypothetical protein